MEQVLTNQTVNGSSDPFRFSGSHQDHVVYVAGTFDSAVITLEATPDKGTTWIPVSGGEFTEAGVRTVDYIPSDCRVTMASAGASTDINVWIEGGGYR